jgi:F-type H+-transporting ATPase subunit b
MLDFSVTFIITIVNIIILTVILRAALFKPVTKFMAERAKKVKDSLEKAEEDEAKAQRLLGQYQGKLKNAEADVQEIIRIARTGAEAEAKRIISDGRAKVESMISSARVQIEAERQAALARFKIEAAALVLAASSRLVQREISGEDKIRYANMLLDELASHKEVE